jgi:predicted CXXCH cytochrome family protein
VIGVLLVSGIAVWAVRRQRLAETPPAREAARPAHVEPVRVTPAREARYVGAAACGECHAEEMRRWTGSHHDRAMEKAGPDAVLGDFDTTFTRHGITTTFSRRDGKYVVRTDGPDGTLQDYEVAYTFGVDPLQQYLLPLPGGRYQALSIAWDTRPKDQGGQRWFHLYPDEPIAHDDVLHWTKPSQNWNDRCARCHSTDLRKGYRFADDRYETTWAALDVSCEACHGPGSAHVAWAALEQGVRPADDGLTVDLRARAPATWTFGDETGIARRTPPRTDHAELETCAPCHARRGELADGAAPGRPLLDDYLPALLDDGLYFADGQIRDEVYEWGSFVQSRMFAAGVTCSDCHDPHDLGLRASGNAVCAQCHLPARFDTPEHHFHDPGSAGTQCVACHMPARTYMQIDVRHDHGFRVPRPDLSAETGAPDACTTCHDDRTPAWAAGIIAARPGPHRTEPHWGSAIAAGRRGAADAEPQLSALARDPAAPEIARATATAMLGRLPGPAALATVHRSAGDDAAELLRLAASEAASDQDPRSTAAIAGPRLGDPRRAVRFAAARALAGEAGTLLSDEGQAALARTLDEYRVTQREHADRPESHLNLGLLAMRLGNASEADAALRTAIRRWPYFVPAYVNLADLLRAQERDGEGERVLRDAVRVEPESAEVHHALGLLLVRLGRTGEALPELERAAALAPDDGRYAYVLGVALNSSGATDRALAVLRAAHERRPGDASVLLALATISRDAGRLDEARRWAALLAEATPWDAGARRFRDQLSEGGGNS